jgi:hypothetical protein
MPCYRIHRLKDHLHAAFRSAPHVSGAAEVKARDYAPGDLIEAASPYAAFFALRETESRLEVGDLLEGEDGCLRICKFVGFEEARWLVSEPALVASNGTGEKTDCEAQRVALE